VVESEVDKVPKDKFVLVKLREAKLKLLNSAESSWLNVLKEIKEVREEGKLRKLLVEFNSKLNVVKNQFSSEEEKLFIEKFVLNNDIILILLVDV
jgi:hypothetical protein